MPYYGAEKTYALILPNDVTYPYSVTVKLGDNVDGSLFIPWTEEDINADCRIAYSTLPDPEEMTNQAILQIESVQYNYSEDINMQFIGTEGDTTMFKLRVIYPRAPHNAIGLMWAERLVYPGEIIEMSAAHFKGFAFRTLGYQRERMFLIPLNEQTTSTSMPLQYRGTGNFNSVYYRETGYRVTELRGTNPAVAGCQIKITTPKGSFIVSAV